MNSRARIHSIYLAPLAGMPTQSMNCVRVRAGIGIDGDRYALGTGAYSPIEPSKIRRLSLITLSGINIANDWIKASSEPTFDSSETRRNIIPKGITPNELNLLVGQQFLLGCTLLKVH